MLQFLIEPGSIIWIFIFALTFSNISTEWFSPSTAFAQEATEDPSEEEASDEEDTRIPITATKLSYLGSGWELNAVALHEFRFNKRASEGTDFDPYIGLRGSFAIEDDALPEGDDSDVKYFQEASEAAKQLLKGWSLVEI